MKDSLGSRLVFLVSQPRAGSTLLQRLLGGSPQVHTVAEPWVLLHPLYATRRVGILSEFHHYIAHAAVRGFLHSEGMPEGVFHEAVRAYAWTLYEKALASSGKQLFLDKTPRYYWIANELLRVFPEAKIIVLVRNPLGVLSSIWRSWVLGKGSPITRYTSDLLVAPTRLRTLAESKDPRVMCVRYEDILQSPEGQLKALCAFLGAPYEPQMIEYGAEGNNHWAFGDQTKVIHETGPCAGNANNWQEDVKNSPKLWRLTFDYLSFLGKDGLEWMGYSYQECHDALSGYRPPLVGLRTKSLALSLLDCRSARNRWQRLTIRAYRRLHPHPTELL